jgi:hypothetical protein
MPRSCRREEPNSISSFYSFYHTYKIMNQNSISFDTTRSMTCPDRDDRRVQDDILDDENSVP